MENKALQTQQVNSLAQVIHNKAVQALEPSDRGIVEAQLSPLLSDCSNDMIVTMLLRVFNLIGLPTDKWPGYNPSTGKIDIQLEKDALYYDMKVHLPGIRIKDVEQAFIAAIHGHLRKGKEAFDLNNYGNKFSFKYLGECLAAYGNYSKEVLRQYSIKRKQLEAFPPIPPPLTEEQKKQNCKEFYEELVEFIEKNKSFPFTWAYDKAFLHAEREGIIKDSVLEKEKFAEAVKGQLKEEAEAERLKHGKDAMRSMITNALNPNNLKYECRKRRLITYLKNKHGI